MTNLVLARISKTKGRKGNYDYEELKDEEQIVRQLWHRYLHDITDCISRFLGYAIIR